ncbi:MAG: hypothetical protein AB7U61_00245 [Methylocystis sp.]
MLRGVFLIAAVIAGAAFTQPVLADHKRHVAPERHPSHARCVRSGWNHHSCAHLRHYGGSADYYHHHDRRRHHGMTF